MINPEEQKLYDILNRLEIKYIRHKHKPVYTVEEADNLDIDIPGQHCKNLFLRNKKGNIHYLVIAGSKKQIDLKALSKQIGSLVNFHPNVNTATIGVSYADLEKFIRWHENKFQYIE